jgi:hypothetical protein
MLPATLQTAAVGVGPASTCSSQDAALVSPHLMCLALRHASCSVLQSASHAHHVPTQTQAPPTPFIIIKG